MKNTVKLSKNRLIIMMVVYFTCTFNALGEFNCTSEVSYKWRPLNSTAEATKEKGEEEKEVKKEDSTQEVFFGTIQATGPDEEKAKNAVQISINKAKGRSDSACKDLHENQSKCIATKYTSNAAVLNGLTFDQRKALQDSIADDCKRMTGNCLGSIASEAKCSEAKAEEEKKDEKGDAKGDKKADAKKK